MTKQELQDFIVAYKSNLILSPSIKIAQSDRIKNFVQLLENCLIESQANGEIEAKILLTICHEVELIRGESAMFLFLASDNPFRTLIKNLTESIGFDVLSEVKQLKNKNAMTEERFIEQLTIIHQQRVEYNTIRQSVLNFSDLYKKYLKKIRETINELDKSLQNDNVQFLQMNIKFYQGKIKGYKETKDTTSDHGNRMKAKEKIKKAEEKIKLLKDKIANSHQLKAEILKKKESLNQFIKEIEIQKIINNVGKFFENEPKNGYFSSMQFRQLNRTLLQSQDELIEIYEFMIERKIAKLDDTDFAPLIKAMLQEQRTIKELYQHLIKLDPSCDNDFPLEFICPISLSLMLEPVTNVKDEYDFDREAIMQWLEKNPTSPTTRIVTKSSDIIPNRALKREIKKYLLEKIKIAEKNIQAERDKHSLENMKSNLNSSPLSNASKEKIPSKFEIDDEQKIIGHTLHRS